MAYGGKTTMTTWKAGREYSTPAMNSAAPRFAPMPTAMPAPATRLGCRTRLARRQLDASPHRNLRHHVDGGGDCHGTGRQRPLEIFDTALKFVPQKSRFHKIVSDSLNEVSQASDWLDGYNRIHGKYAEYSHCAFTRKAARSLTHYVSPKTWATASANSDARQ
jgi:hypothetical protein